MHVVHNQLYSQKGVPFLDFVKVASSKTVVNAAVQAALYCIDIMHLDGVVHGDARPCNIVIFRGVRDKGSNFWIGQTPYFVAFVDFETMYVPPQTVGLTEDMKKQFNAVANSLKMFGMMPYRKYAELGHTTYKFDVHAFCDDCLRCVPCTEATQTMLDVLREVRGHTPAGVHGEDKYGRVVLYTQYLNDLSLPVQNSLWAIHALQRAHLPPALVSTVWETQDCKCATFDDVCSACSEKTALDSTNTPYALPDKTAGSDDIVEATMRCAMRACNHNICHLKRQLLMLGARAGDIARLVSYVQLRA